MANYIIGLIILVVAIFSIKGYIKKLMVGCCGGEIEPKKKIKVDLKDYKYSKIINIEGMTCKNCVAHVENELNELEGIYATANLKKKCAVVNMKENINNDILEAAVKKAGYTVVSIADN